MGRQTMKKSSKKAIANHCKECIYDPLSDGTWRQQFQACTITKCHLYEFRPITLKSINLRRENILASLPEHEREIALERRRNSAILMSNLNNRSNHHAD